MLSGRVDRHSLGASELAWALESLLGLGIQARAEGWCLGALRPIDVQFGREGMRRSDPGGGIRGRIRWWLLRLRSHHHLRTGHDLACHSLGVPLPTVLGVLSTWGREDGAALLAEAVDEILAELADDLECGEWTVLGAREAVQAIVHQRITPVPPNAAVLDA